MILPSWSARSFPKKDMSSVDLHRPDHAVEIYGESCHAAPADTGFQVGVEFEEFLFECGEIHIIGVMLFKDAQDLLLDLAVGGTVEGDPDRVVAVLHLQGREVLEVLGEFAVVIVADVEIGEDLDQTGADLAEAGLLALILIGIRFLLDLCRGRRGFIGSCGLRDRGSFSSGSGLLRGAAPGAFRGTAGRGFGGVNLGIGTVGIRARALASGISRVDDVEEYETLAGSAEGLRRPIPITNLPASRSLVASLLKSPSLDTRQNPCTSPV